MSAGVRSFDQAPRSPGSRCARRTDRKEGPHPLTEIVRRLTEDRPADAERGQGLAEYALILALIAIVAILSLVFLGDTINELMSMIGSAVSENT